MGQKPGSHQRDIRKVRYRTKEGRSLKAKLDEEKQDNLHYRSKLDSISRSIHN